MIYQTLHLCHLENVENFDRYYQLVGKNDAVLFFCKNVDATEYNKLMNATVLTENIYFLIENNNDKLPSISYQDWVKLVAQYKRTYTWK